MLATRLPDGRPVVLAEADCAWTTFFPFPPAHGVDLVVRLDRWLTVARYWEVAPVTAALPAALRRRPWGRATSLDSTGRAVGSFWRSGWSEQRLQEAKPRFGLDGAQPYSPSGSVVG